MRVLITGVTGFVGSHLAEYCLEQGHEVAGTFRWRSRDENLSIVKDKVALHDADLRDPVGVRKVIQAFQPERIFHLAAQSYVHASWASPAETLSTNIISQVNLLEAVREAGLTECRIQVAGSSEEYGMVHPDETPIKESNPLRPLSPYAVSKVAQDLMGYQYHESYGMFIVRTRSFNHTGPRRGDVFAESNFAKQIAEIEKGKREPVIYHGNLDAYRDYTDVRDIIRAYMVSLEKCRPGEVYNIGTGNAWRIGDMLDALIDMATVEVTKKLDPERNRPSDVMRLEADASRFRGETGWEPKIPFETTLKDLLDYWRERA